MSRLVLTLASHLVRHVKFDLASDSCVSAVFDRLTSAGVAVHTFDCQGHGKSEPKESRQRAYFERYQDLVSHNPLDLCLSFLHHFTLSSNSQFLSLPYKCIFSIKSQKRGGGLGGRGGRLERARFCTETHMFGEH
jgi:hypothetical protein